MYSNILYLTDLDALHFHHGEQAVRIATCLNASLYLLHVIEQPPSLQLAQGLGFAEIAQPNVLEAQSVLQTLGDALGIPYGHLMVKIGSIKEQAIETISKFHCDLLIIGQHAHHLLPSMLDSSAQAVPNLVPCDVLTLR